MPGLSFDFARQYSLYFALPSGRPNVSPSALSSKPNTGVERRPEFVAMWPRIGSLRCSRSRPRFFRLAQYSGFWVVEGDGWSRSCLFLPARNLSRASFSRPIFLRLSVLPEV